MCDTCHPSFYNIEKLGCNDPSKNTIAFQVYMELCEGKRLWDVNYKYNRELDLVYLEARTTKTSPLQLYVPWPAMNSITLRFIEQVQKELKTERLILVFKEGDSSSVHYRVSAGLVKPASPERTKQLKQIEEKKSSLEREVRKNVSNLYELAKSTSNENENTEICEDYGSREDNVVEDNSKMQQGKSDLENKAINQTDDTLP